MGSVTVTGTSTKSTLVRIVGRGDSRRIWRAIKSPIGCRLSHVGTPGVKSLSSTSLSFLNQFVVPQSHWIPRVCKSLLPFRNHHPFQRAYPNALAPQSE